MKRMALSGGTLAILKLVSTSFDILMFTLWGMNGCLSKNLQLNDNTKSLHEVSHNKSNNIYKQKSERLFLIRTRQKINFHKVYDGVDGVGKQLQMQNWCQ